MQNIGVGTLALPNISTPMRLGALQGPNTFGGEAALLFTQLYPELFGDIVYFDTAEEALGFESDRAGASCAPQQMTRAGFHPGIQAYIAPPNSKLYVIGEVIHAYHCSLLVKPGTELSAIKSVLGHTGSITQTRTWIEEHLPQATITIVDTSSMDAAQKVAAGNGSIASIGTPAMAAQFHLEERVKDVDGGSVGSYWAISPFALFHENPTRVIVAGRFRDDGRMGDVISGVAAAGFRLETIVPLPTGERIFEYDAVLRFHGAGPLAAARSAAESIPGVRLAGAFIAKEDKHG